MNLTSQESVVKICSICGVEKDTTEFSRRGPRLRSHCKACQKAHYQANRERHAEQMKAWRQANREKCSEYDKAYKQANPEKARAKSQRRRARKAGAAGSFTTDQWLARLSYHEYKCVYCGDTEDLQIEHQIPLSRGGSNWPANLVPACPSCNYSKGTKTPKEFYEITRKNR